MSDIFQEVEEEVRRERLERIWKDYGDYIVAAICLVIIAAAGYQLWRVYDQRQRAKASDQYSQAQQLYDSGQIALAAESFAKIAANAPSGYARLASLQEADALLATGKRDQASTIFNKIIAENQPLISDVARIHQGWAIADSAKRADLEKLLAPLLAAKSPWRFPAREILAYSDYRSGDIDKAAAEYDSLAKEKDAPGELHTRAYAMATFLKAGGDKDFGHVPLPAPSLLQSLKPPGNPAGETPAAPAAKKPPAQSPQSTQGPKQK